MQILIRFARQEKRQYQLLEILPLYCSYERIIVIYTTYFVEKLYRSETHWSFALYPFIDNSLQFGES